MDPHPSPLSISPPPPPPPLDAVDFEFSLTGGDGGAGDLMAAADELFFEGKLLPFWETPHLLKKSISLKKDKPEVSAVTAAPPPEEEEDPSPRPPKCTVLWKELLKLRRQKSGGSLSTSSSSSSSSSSEGWSGGVKKKIRVVMPVVSTALPFNPNPSFYLPFISFRQRRRNSSSSTRS